MKINVKSDFDFRISSSGTDPFNDYLTLFAPGCDFEGTIFVKGAREQDATYKFTQSNLMKTNWELDSTDIRVIVKSHSLPPGPLHCELKMLYPNTKYKDGFRTTVMEFPLGITLVESDATELADCVSVCAETMLAADNEQGGSASAMPTVKIWYGSSAPAGSDLVMGQVYLFQKSYTSIDPGCTAGTMWRYTADGWEEYVGDIYCAE